MMSRSSLYNNFKRSNEYLEQITGYGKGMKVFMSPALDAATSMLWEKTITYSLVFNQQPVRVSLLKHCALKCSVGYKMRLVFQTRTARCSCFLNWNVPVPEPVKRTC